MAWQKPFKKVLLTINASLFISIGLQAQTKLSLSEAIKIVEKNNLSLKIDQKTTESAKKDYHKSTAIFLPQISISHTAIGTTNPLMAFGSKLNQEILTQQDFNPALLNDPDYISNYSTKISVQQPIINVDGFYQRKAAKLKSEYLEYQNKYKKDFVILEVKKAYMQLQVALKQVSVLEKAQKTAEANLKYANNNLKQGYLQKSDFIDVEVRVMDIKNQLQMAKSNALNASNYFALLLNLDKKDTTIIPTDELTLNVDTLLTNHKLSENRSDLMAMNSAFNAQKKMLLSTKSKYLPKLNAFGNLELYDDKLFGTDAKGYLIGAQLSWDIFQGGTQLTSIQKNKIEVEKTALTIDQYTKQSQLEITKTHRNLIDAQNSVLLSKKSAEQSKEALRIRTNRFIQGLENTTDLLMAETKYAEKQFVYLNAIFNYNYTVEYLKFLTKEN